MEDGGGGVDLWMGGQISHPRNSPMALLILLPHHTMVGKNDDEPMKTKV